jgi:multidrug efflux pump subunit AcrB
VENREGKLIYLKNIIEIEEVLKPVNIARIDYKRTSMIYANINPKSKTTPLQMAERLESDVFPTLIQKYTSSIISFKGEIEDSRESQGEFKNSIIIVVLLIYFILVVMFDSLTKPFLILTIVPFGLAGVIYILLLHGMNVFGFFAAIGTLGMIGVVINDSIVMIDMMDKNIQKATSDPWLTIARIASTRLRPILLTTLTTVVGVLPTAYGFAGFDSMLAEMMLTMGWGLAFGTIITLILIPSLYTFIYKKKKKLSY